jgi:hypothetical protein
MKTLRELIAGATTPCTLDRSLYDQMRMREANEAHFRARCSPDTMLLVVDYLETVKQHCESPLRDCINVDHLQKMTNELLSTLNGQPAKNE